MMTTWMFWIGFVLIMVGAVPAGYVWYGRILKIVGKEKARKVWLFGTILLILGMVVLFGSMAMGLPEETEAQEEAAEAWLPYMWLGVGIILAGGLPAALVAQSRVLDMVGLRTAQKAFKTGYVLLVVGIVILIWAMVPGHILP